jgi:hypothetical protein
MINDDIFDRTHPKFPLKITVDVPIGYIAVFTFSDAEYVPYNDRVVFSASDDLNYSQIAVAIAKFQIVDTKTATFYFSSNRDVENTMSRISPIMTHANNFMNEHFGERTSEKKLRVIEIPVGFGSFAEVENHVTFTEGGAFESDFEMRQLVHEFIHTGWNAITEDYHVRRARFFDEAFTMYFEFRIMSELLGKDTYDWYTTNILPSTRGIDSADLVPITEFGIYYGALSYTIGAFSLYKLSQLIGIELFDNITTLFLDKYQKEPVDFEKFCAFYIKHSEHTDVEDFFRRWIYTNVYVDDL